MILRPSCDAPSFPGVARQEKGTSTVCGGAFFAEWGLAGDPNPQPGYVGTIRGRLGLLGRIDETCQSVCALSGDTKAHSLAGEPPHATRRRIGLCLDLRAIGKMT